MNKSTFSGEKITAIASTLVAIAILAAGVTAQQQHTSPRDQLTQLESDLNFQLEMAFRHDRSNRKLRLKQLEEVKTAWNNSRQTERDRQLIADWLLESTVRSMPGSIKDFPAIPEFGSRESEVLKTDMNSPHTFDSVEEDIAEDPFTSTSAEELPVVPNDVFTAQDHKTEIAIEKILQERSLLVPEASKQAAQPAKQAQINLVELASRIQGYHQGLDQIASSLQSLEKAELDDLAKLINQLDGMTRDFRFVKLYYEALNDQERRAIQTPRSLQAMVSEIEKQIARGESSHTGDFLSDFESGSTEKADQLRQQLSAIAKRVN